MLFEAENFTFSFYVIILGLQGDWQGTSDSDICISSDEIHEMFLIKQLKLSFSVSLIKSSFPRAQGDNLKLLALSNLQPRAQRYS